MEEKVFKLKIYIEKALSNIVFKLDDRVQKTNEMGEYVLSVEPGEHKITVISNGDFWGSAPKLISYRKDKHSESLVSFARVKYNVNSLYYELYFCVDSKFDGGEINLKLDKKEFFNFSGGFSKKLDITAIKNKRVNIIKERKRYFPKCKLLLFFLVNFFVQTVIHGLFFSIPFSAFFYCINNKSEVLPAGVTLGVPNKYYIIFFAVIFLIIFFIWLFGILRLVREVFCDKVKSSRFFMF